MTLYSGTKVKTAAFNTFGSQPLFSQSDPHELRTVQMITEETINEMEQNLIREALERLMEGRTSFIIAHRIQTIMRADKILVLDKGRIVQQGAHRELIQQDGLYKQIYELQAQVEQSVGEVGHVGHTI